MPLCEKMCTFILNKLFNKNFYKTRNVLPSKLELDGYNKELNVLMFHVDWCPHCKKALPEWVAFCNEYNNKVVNNYKITCDKQGTNCTDDDSAEIKKLIAEYNIVSYPTVVLIKDNKRYDFDAKITKHTLEQFINSVSM